MPTLHRPPTQLPFLDLFAGAGGLSSGLERAGLAPVAAVEADPNACRTYASLHPGAEVLDADIAAVAFGQYRENVEVVVGGPPCQPFSTGGLRRLGEDTRDGFPHFLRALREVRPDAFLIENVAGLARGAAKRYLAALLRELSDLGFFVSWSILNAVNFGVPQHRQRLFIVGCRRRPFRFPPPTHGQGQLAPWVSSGTVLSPDRAIGAPNNAIVTYAKTPDLRPSPYDGHLFNGGGRPIDLDSPSRTILASAGGNKTQFVDTLGIVPAYHDSLLRGGPVRSGTVPGARRISVAESAALQTFSPDARFAGPTSVQYRLVGNAVPPLLAEALGRALWAPLAATPRSARAA